MDYIVKAVIFVPFMGIVYLFVDFFKEKLYDAISSLTYASLFCQFGIFDGLGIFFTILISSFVAKQAISFVK